MNLNFGKSYVLSTLHKTVNAVKVKVRGVLDYAQTKKYPFQLSALAINETVVTGNSTITAIDNYFSDKVFYLCEDGSGTLYMVWPEIIDPNLTISALHIAKGSIQLTVDSDSGANDDEIIAAIISFVNTQYNNKVVVQITPEAIVNLATSDEDLYKELIAESRTVLEGFRSLSSLVPLLNKIGDLDLGTQLAGIQAQVGVIQTSVAKIAQIIR